jgi:hypothetical protein
VLLMWILSIMSGFDIDPNFYIFSSTVLSILFGARPVQMGIEYGVGVIRKRRDDSTPTPTKPKPITIPKPQPKPTPTPQPQTAGFALTIESLRCNDGTAVPRKYRKNAEKLLQNLEVIWNAAGRGKITVTSGYRTPEWNAQEGGSETSRHMQAKAIDFLIAGMTKVQLRDLIGRLMDQGKITPGGYYAGKKNFVHYDIGGIKQLIR